MTIPRRAVRDVVHNGIDQRESRQWKRVLILLSVHKQHTQQAKE